MENRSHGFTISKPQPIQNVQEKKATTAPPPPNNGARPLSDIRELSEPSVIDAFIQRPGNQHPPNPNAARSNSVARKESQNQILAAKNLPHNGKLAHKISQSADNGSSSYSSTPEKSSFYSIPHSSVPQRSSSQSHAQRPARRHARKPSIRDAPPPAHPRFEGFTVPNHGPSRSPVKDAQVRSDAVKSDVARRMPSRTYIRTPHPTDILEFPSYKHPRLRLDLQVSAPVFVGGGSVEGQVRVTVDENQRLKSRRTFEVSAISIDLLGFEDMPGSRKATFLAIGTELIDAEHPPPANMVEPANPLTPEDKFWRLAPSTSSLPFMVSLPLDTGPPPFRSKHANIRFLLCATALIRDAGKHYRVRTSQDICVLATYDPEKALSSLPSPLVAADELSLPRLGRCEAIKLTAGLHRQVWVSGSSIFVDVHIANKSHKPVKRLELSLERDILCYKHAPAGTREESASQARIFESNEQAMITRMNMKFGVQGWSGVEPHCSDTRTCELELPRGHATVRCGKYFEVRYFLNVTASLSNSKLVSVQLPIILVHINSLDVVPNSVAQVAAAIEEKRTRNKKRSKSRQDIRIHSRNRSASSPAAMADLRRRPSYGQGRAFAAPRQQSIDRQRAARADIDSLRQTLDSSPRKHGPRLQGTVIKKMGSNMSFGAISLDGGGSSQNLFHTTHQTAPVGRATDRFERSTDESAGGLQCRPTRKCSTNSVLRKASAASSRSGCGTEHGPKPRYNFTVVQNRIEPHVLGLATSASKTIRFASDGASDAIPRPGTGLSFREKMDRSRFEFKGVRRKASGSIKERGMNWWEQVKHRDKEKEGWI